MDLRSIGGSSSDIKRTAITRTKSAGNIRLALAKINFPNVKSPRRCPFEIIWVIRKPEIAKKTSTPAKPPANPGTLKWNNTTDATAIALSRLISVRNFEEPEFIVRIFCLKKTIFIWWNLELPVLKQSTLKKLSFFILCGGPLYCSRPTVPGCKPARTVSFSPTQQMTLLCLLLSAKQPRPIKQCFAVQLTAALWFCNARHH